MPGSLPGSTFFWPQLNRLKAFVIQLILAVGLNVTNPFLDDFIKRTPSSKELTLVSFFNV